MLVKHTSQLTLAAAFALSGAMAADAATITKVVSFSGNSFVDQSLNPGLAPVDPVTGQFTITLDPSATVTDVTSGITLNSLNIVLDSALAFNYDQPLDRLEVGGIQTGANTVQFDPSTNDFWFFVNGFLSGTPLFDQIGYSQTSVSRNNLFFTLNQTGSVTVSDPAPSPVPLPAAFPLLLGAFASLTLLRRRTARANA